MKFYSDFNSMFGVLFGSKNSTDNQTRSTVKIMVDYENNAEEWWDNGGRELWREFGGSNNKDEIYLTERAAEEMERRAKLISGYCDGPYHAPTALIFDYDV